MLGFGGVTLVVWDKLGFGGLSRGRVCLLDAGAGQHHLGTLYQKRYCADLDLWSGSVIGSSPPRWCCCHSLAFETMRVAWTSSGSSSALGWLIFVLSLGAISPAPADPARGGDAGVGAVLVPPTTALLAFLIFGEKLGLAAVAGIAIAAAGVAIAVRK
ncbi:MAG: hypothetical protein IPG91_13010 [Ideonella sp.]|nr:hypothetical protein [Ideonella sp.]